MQKRVLEEHQDNISRQISRLSDIVYQASDIYTPYADPFGNQSTFSRQKYQISKVYPSGTNNPHLSKLLIAEHDNSPQKSYRPLISHPNPNMGVSGHVSKTGFKGEAQHLYRLSSSIFEMDEVMKQVYNQNPDAKVGLMSKIFSPSKKELLQQ